MSPNYSQKVLPIGFEPWDPIPCGRKRRAPSASDAPGGPGLGLGKMPENDSQCRPWPHRPWHNLRYIPTTFSSIVARFRNQHRQGTPSGVGGRKTMYQIQTKVTMEQKQVNQALLQLQQQNLLQIYTANFTSLHTRVSHEHHRQTAIQAPMQSILKTSMQGPRGFQQDLVNNFSRRLAQDHAKAFGSIHQDPHPILSQKTVTRILLPGQKECNKIILKKAWSRPDKILIQNLLKNLAKAFIEAPL